MRLSVSPGRLQAPSSKPVSSLEMSCGYSCEEFSCTTKFVCPQSSLRPRRVKSVVPSHHWTSYQLFDYYRLCCDFVTCCQLLYACISKLYACISKSMTTHRAPFGRSSAPVVLPIRSRRNVNTNSTSSPVTGLSRSANFSPLGVNSDEAPFSHNGTERTAECVICMQTPAEYCSIKCGHVCMCGVCCHAVTKCPICRAAIPDGQVLRIHLC
jgi:hypothetical protein